MSESSDSTSRLQEQAPYSDEHKQIQGDQEEQLAVQEDRAVQILRIVVALILLGVAISVSTAIFLVMRNDQQDDFQDRYDAYAHRVVESFRNGFQRYLEGVGSLGMSLTSYAIGTASSWPRVLLPDYEIRAASARIMSGAVVLNFSPLVKDEDREEWELFVKEHGHSMFTNSEATELELIKKQDARFGYSVNDKMPGNHTLRPTTYGYYANFTIGPVVPGSGPFLPIWQPSPVVQSNIIGFDILSHPIAKAAFHHTLKSRRVVITSADNLNGEHWTSTGDLFQAILRQSQFRHQVDTYLGDPVSTMGFPVFKDFSSQREVVGVISTNIYWNVLFRNLLPRTARGIIVVLENTFNQTFSYRIDADEATYLGVGDYHDPKYSDMEVFVDIAKYLKESDSPQTRSFTSPDLDTDYCTYNLRVYPSKDTEDDSVNNEPLVLMLMAAGIFAFTTTVFLLYDVLVDRRQKIVMARAIASGAIVSSLFPSNVRDQLYEEKEEQQKQASNWREDSPPIGRGTSKVARPIAQRYDATSIMFADLAGFTKWSTTRTPEQVFHLLETIYGEFDAIATRRKVFKVETIGDCYVAVTGIPDPQTQHAIIMARFARDCMIRMSQLVRELSDTLGRETVDLSFRVGIHSGPVTGGVIRGEKSRFQLFGDTMNTAARMESNGVVGRIHVSQETADELTNKGKGHWLVPRADKIVAKGKGELQTYFVQIKSSPSCSSTQTAATDDDDEDLVDTRTMSGLIMDRLKGESPTVHGK